MKGKRIFSSIITAIIIAGTFGTSIMAEVKAYSSETMATAVKAHQLDVDGDGKLSIADAVALMRFVAEDRNAKVKNAYDADDDGLISESDVEFLVKYLSRIKVSTIVDQDIPVEYYTLTTPETTTATTPTTTNSATTSTNKATTTSTTKAGTTTSTNKATTTSTTKAGTTTSTTKATTTTLTTKATTTTSTTKATTTTSTTKATTTTSTTKATTTTSTTKATTTTLTTKATTTTSTTKATITTTTTKATTTTTTTKATTTTSTTKATTTTSTTKATTTTSTTKATTTTTSTTNETTTTTTTTTANSKNGIPDQNSVTTPEGAIISDYAYNTLVEYAKEIGIEDCNIIYTDHKIIEDSIFYLRDMDASSIGAAGAFHITTGEKFYEKYKEYFENDPNYDEDDAEYIRQHKYIIWRVCTDEYLNEYEDNELWYFDDIEELRFTVWEEGFFQFSEWALVPKDWNYKAE